MYKTVTLLYSFLYFAFFLNRTLRKSFQVKSYFRQCPSRGGAQGADPRMSNEQDVSISHCWPWRDAAWRASAETARPRPLFHLGWLVLTDPKKSSSSLQPSRCGLIHFCQGKGCKVISHGHFLSLGLLAIWISTSGNSHLDLWLIHWAVCLPLVALWFLYNRKINLIFITCIAGSFLIWAFSFYIFLV